jgi:prophage regulatory protein
MPMTDTSNRFLRLNAVLDKTGLSRSTLYRKIGEGTFPKQVAISARCAAWLEADVEAWMLNPMSYEATDCRMK